MINLPQASCSIVSIEQATQTDPVSLLVAGHIQTSIS